MVKIDLTSRERVILSRIVEGLSNEQIAEALNLNVDTVRIHINLLYRVLGVDNRLQVALWAIKNLDSHQADDQPPDEIEDRSSV